MAGRSRVRSTPRTRSPWPRSSTVASRSSRCPRWSIERSTPSRAHGLEISTTSSPPTARHGASPRGRWPPHERSRLDPRSRVPDPHPRGRSLLHLARRRDATEELQRRLRAAAGQGQAARHRVRRSVDSSRRLRQDSGDAPSGGEGRRHQLRPGDPRPSGAPRTRRAAEASARRGGLRPGQGAARGVQGAGRVRRRARGGPGDPGARECARPGGVLASGDVEAHRRDPRGPGTNLDLRHRPVRDRLHGRAGHRDDHRRSGSCPGTRPPRRGSNRATG